MFSYKTIASLVTRSIVLTVSTIWFRRVRLDVSIADRKFIVDFCNWLMTKHHQLAYSFNASFIKVYMFPHYECFYHDVVNN